MAKFKFRMQGYLNIKEKIEDQCKQEYGLAVAEVEREKQKKQEILEEKEEQLEKFKISINQNIDSQGFSAYNNYIEYLKNAAVAQDKVILEARKKAEKKRLALVEAMKDRKILEKLSERQYEEYRLEEKLAEQKTIDEVVSYRFNN